MGNDGSLKLSRKDLITKQIPKSTEIPHQATQTTCPLSNDNLTEPLFADYRGQLYNKLTILEYLVSPSDFSEAQRELVSHISSKRDVVEVKCHLENDGRLKCPITGDLLGMKGVQFVYPVQCGDVFSLRALKELNIDGKEKKKCPVCDEGYEEQDLIVIGATGGDLDTMENRMMKLREKGLTHSLKKKRKDSDKGRRKKRKV